MELFVWCWIWDRRMLCGLRHGTARFIYLWIFPFLVSIIILPYAGMLHYRNTTTREKCDWIPEVQDKANTVTILLHIQEGILALTILTSFGMIVRTKNIFNRLAPH